MTTAVSETIEVYFTATPTDITSYALGYSISRGRSREIDEINAGTCTIALRNYDGRFVPDAFVAGTPYTGNVLPGKRVRITTESTVIFDGFVDGWFNQYDEELRVESRIDCYDALGWLARTELDEHVATVDQVAGERLTSIVGRPEVGWTGTTAFAGQGISPLQGNTVAQGTNTLVECQLVARTDQGRFFASRVGALAYLDRRNLVESSSALTIADDGTGIPHRRAELAYSADLLTTKATVTRVGGAPRTSDDAAAQTEYGIRRRSIAGTLHITDSQAADMAAFIVANYKDPQARVTPVRIMLDDLSTSDVDALCELDIGSKVDFVWTPTGSAEINTSFGVEGVAHVVDFESAHVVELALSPIFGVDLFTLDDATLGQLDTGGVLAY